MQAELQGLFAILWMSLLLGLGGFFLKVILSVVLKNRIAPGLVPRLDEIGRPDSLTRFVALIGQNAAPAETLGTVRLRASLGLQLAYWAVSLALALIINRMGVPAMGVETFILLLVLLMALHTSLYEIRYDRQTITLPRWWFGKTTRKWDDLLSVTSPDGWFMRFHFEGGTRIFVHKYVVGHRQLLETACKAIREN